MEQFFISVLYAISILISILRVLHTICTPQLIHHVLYEISMSCSYEMAYQLYKHSSLQLLYFIIRSLLFFLHFFLFLHFLRNFYNSDL